MYHQRTAPTKDDIASLEPFIGLEREQIFVVTTERQADIALEELLNAKAVGFDTEAKPTFRKGEESTGPHVFQFATLEKAFIFQTYYSETKATILKALENEALQKYGFGLSGDREQIGNKFGIRPASMFDLDQVFKKMGYRNSLGAKAAVALLMKQKFNKSKSTTTSNWAAPILTDRQLIYAANDAYAALKIHDSLTGE